MIKHYLEVMLLALIAVGCSNNPFQRPVISPGATIATSLPIPRVSNTAKPTKAPSPTALGTLPSTPRTQVITNTPLDGLESHNALQSTPIPILLDPSRLGLIKINAFEDNLGTATSVGTLVLQDVSNNRAGNYFFLNLSKNNKVWLDVLDQHCWTVSPNRDKLVCEKNEKLIIKDNLGRTVKSINIKDESLSILGWLNNNQVMFSKEGYPIAHTIILNPNTGEQEDIGSDYPKINIFGPFDVTRFFLNNELVYDPTSQFVVYPSLDMTDVVWDRFKNRVIEEIPIAEIPSPQWSPDGQEVIIAGKGERSNSLSLHNADASDLFRVSLSGEVKRLTNLSQDFPNSSLFDMSWSPDGRRIAFQFEAEDSVCSLRCIMIVDNNTFELMGFLLPDGYESQASLYPVSVLTWSPDNRQLLLEVFPTNDYDKTFLVILDIESRTAFRVADEAKILGWMRDNY